MGRFIPTLAIAAAVALGLSGCMQHEAMMGNTFKAHLTSKQEVPPNTSTAVGDGVFKFDSGTKTLSWTIDYNGLTGPATAAHIHGPAAMGANAGVLIPFNVPKTPAGEITGSKVLTDAQVADLEAGKLYANIHTDAHKGGEIRGQILK